MSAVEKPQPTLTQPQLRLLVLIVLLALAVGFAIGFKFMTVAEVAVQVVQGLASAAGGAALVFGGRR